MKLTPTTPTPTPTPTLVKKPTVNGVAQEGIRLIIAEADYQAPLVICTSGAPGAGKSRLIGTSPGDYIGLIATESKSKQTVTRTATQFGKQVVLPDKDLIRVGNPVLISNLPNTCIVIGDAKHKDVTPGKIQDEMQEIADRITLDSDHPTCCKRHYYRWHCNRVKYSAFLMFEDSRIKTIAIDPMGQFVDDVSYANYGLTGVIDPKEFGFAPRQDMNNEIRDFLNLLSGKHLVLTHHLKDVWKDGKPTNKKKPASQFSDIGHYATVMVEQTGPSGRDIGEDDPRYILSVKDCQANAELIGLDLLQDDDITFGNLAALVYPDAAEGAFD